MFRNRKEVCLRCCQFHPICEEVSPYSIEPDVHLCRSCWAHLTAYHGRESVRRRARNVLVSLKKNFDDGFNQ